MLKKNKYFFLIIAVALAAGIYFLFTKNNTPTPEPEVAVVDTTPPEPRVEFGLVTDSFEIVKGEIQPNQFLADILLKHHIPYTEIDRMVRTSEEVFDVKKLRAGNDYTIFCTKDSLGKAQCFVYQPNAVEYVVFDLRDSMSVYKGEKEIVRKEKTVEGVINSSLYMTLDEIGVSPVLALEMGEIYAWTIDFYHIQKGDHFKVVYEENFVDDESIGIGKIKAANFIHKNEDFYAFWFVQDSVGDYFDDKAQSLRKAFLQMPLKFGRLSSAFTMRRFHPVQKRYKAHLGTDYAAPTGTPILAVGDGTVTESAFKKYNGNYVKIKHNSTYTTQYLHMSKRAAKAGQHVRQGDVIGYVGSTGLATGPHVCFRFWKNGQQVDHRQEKFPPSKPVNPSEMDRYQELIDDWMKRLQAEAEKPAIAQRRQSTKREPKKRQQPSS